MFVGCAHSKKSCGNNNRTNLVLKKKIIPYFLLFFAFLFFMTNLSNLSTNYCYADEPQEDIEKELEEKTSDIVDDIDFSYLEEVADEFDFKLFGGLGFKEFVLSVIAGDETISIADILNIVVSSLKDSIKKLLAPLLSILVIVLLCSMFNNIRSSKISGVGEMICFVCFAIVVIIVASLSAGLVSSTKNSLLSLQKQMNSIFPILITLMGLMGGVVSVKAYSPMLAFLSNAVSNIFIYVLLPLFSFSLILSFIGNLSKNTRLDKLRDFIASLFKWVIGTTFAIFLSFLTIQGITAGSSDKVSIKATKFAIKNYIPFLGGYISDGFELIKAGGLIVKNAVGFAGIILLFATIIMPLLSIGLLELSLKLLAGVIEPTMDKRSSTLLYDIAKSFKLLVAIIIGVALMYFLTMILVTITLSNVL